MLDSTFKIFLIISENTRIDWRPQLARVRRTKVRGTEDKWRGMKRMQRVQGSNEKFHFAFSQTLLKKIYELSKEVFRDDLKMFTFVKVFTKEQKKSQ